MKIEITHELRKVLTPAELLVIERFNDIYTEELEKFQEEVEH